ncbi:hypothetical protein AB0K34_04910 [Actinomadura sp. NPDC049382]|uniref:hypothetical protein n=1 Tax=Actinomadura sp. NPDC049382 TaxID=3158220 RepID=UPI00341489D8
MNFPHGETVVRIRVTPGGRDPYGDPIGDVETRTDVTGCAVAPRQAGEQIGQGRIAATSGVTIYVPPDTDVLPSDRFEVRGAVWEVDGEPAVWRSPFTGWEPGREVQLTRVEEGAA